MATRTANAVTCGTTSRQGTRAVLALRALRPCAFCACTLHWLARCKGRWGTRICLCPFANHTGVQSVSAGSLDAQPSVACFGRCIFILLAAPLLLAFLFFFFFFFPRLLPVMRFGLARVVRVYECRRLHQSGSDEMQCCPRRCVRLRRDTKSGWSASTPFPPAPSDSSIALLLPAEFGNLLVPWSSKGPPPNAVRMG